MTFAARLRVVSGPETVGDALRFLEDELVVVERSQRDHGVFVNGVEIRSLRIEPICEAVEGGGRLTQDVGRGAREC